MGQSVSQKYLEDREIRDLIDGSLNEVFPFTELEEGKCYMYVGADEITKYVDTKTKRRFFSKFRPQYAGRYVGTKTIQSKPSSFYDERIERKYGNDYQYEPRAAYTVLVFKDSASQHFPVHEIGKECFFIKASCR